MRIMMIIAERPLVLHERRRCPKARYGTVDKMNFEAAAHVPLVWLTSIVSVVPDLHRPRISSFPSSATATLWWKLSTIITCGTLAGANHPRNW